MKEEGDTGRMAKRPSRGTGQGSHVDNIGVNFAGGEILDKERDRWLSTAVEELQVQHVEVRHTRTRAMPILSFGRNKRRKKSA